MTHSLKTRPLAHNQDIRDCHCCWARTVWRRHCGEAGAAVEQRAAIGRVAILLRRRLRLRHKVAHVPQSRQLWLKEVLCMPLNIVISASVTTAPPNQADAAADWRLEHVYVTHQSGCTPAGR